MARGLAMSERCGGVTKPVADAGGLPSGAPVSYDRPMGSEMRKRPRHFFTFASAGAFWKKKLSISFVDKLPHLLSTICAATCDIGQQGLASRLRLDNASVCLRLAQLIQSVTVRLDPCRPMPSPHCEMADETGCFRPMLLKNWG